MYACPLDASSPSQTRPVDAAANVVVAVNPTIFPLSRVREELTSLLATSPLSLPETLPHWRHQHRSLPSLFFLFPQTPGASSSTVAGVGELNAFSSLLIFECHLLINFFYCLMFCVLRLGMMSVIVKRKQICNGREKQDGIGGDGTVNNSGRWVPLSFFATEKNQVALK
ncbi:uncharacterized protein LOC111241287 [Vigna radiata var. radiata]|uniref:Uncharacterized protein LOC111241287 n=1 Tax=Vigna radiata var. radiata TaxID=3916 RepID=A0A3Q0EVF4_VIGRR|nr:uncharacterized protein LOC111241287 [Vigna radiata var. radiata]